MPDLAVFFDPQGAADTGAAAARMLHQLREGVPACSEIEVTDRNIAAVNVLKPFSYAREQPVKGREGWLLFDGALHEPIRGHDGGLLDPAGGLAALLEWIAEGDGERLLQVNGHYNAVYYHPPGRQLTIVTDRLGTRPLYHGTDGKRHVVASEVKAVLAGLQRCPDLDPLGVLELFAFGHNISNRTVLEGISVLPAGSIITLDERGLHAAPYFRYRYRPEEGRLSLAQWGRRIAEGVKEAVPRHLQGEGRKSIFLSGGLDSRIVAAALGGGTPPLTAFTFGRPDSRDVVFAADLARSLGFEHRVLTYPPVYLSKVIRSVVARTECAAPFFHATSVLFHDTLAESADAIVVGFCGDAFSGAHLRSAMFKTSSRDLLAGLIFERALCTGRKALGRVFRAEALDRLWPELEAAFRGTVEAIEGQTGPDLADVWDVEQRQRRFTFSAPKVDRSRFEILAPLVDNRLVDLVLTLPAHARRHQGAYKHAIVAGFPCIRNVPWAATGRPIRLNPLADRSQEVFRLAVKALRVGLGKTGIRLPGMAWRFRNVGEEMRIDRDFFEGCLLPFMEHRDFPGDLLDGRGIRSLGEDHCKGLLDASHLLGVVSTLGVFTELCTAWKK